MALCGLTSSLFGLALLLSLACAAASLADTVQGTLEQQEQKQRRQAGLPPGADPVSLPAPCLVPPPAPLLPIPNARQLEWQRREMAMFMHFGVNTFTNQEWGTGHEDPSVFAPPAIFADQWISTARAGGFQVKAETRAFHFA